MLVLRIEEMVVFFLKLVNQYWMFVFNLNHYRHILNQFVGWLKIIIVCILIIIVWFSMTSKN